jgi:CubicO group peptidase (beta-lactamase class C family)
MPPMDQLDVESRIRGILNRRPAVGLAVGVVRDGRLESFHAHGLADIASRTPVTEDTVFRVGSLTKTFTAIAVMQLQGQGLVDLDAPANHYLRGYRLIPADPDWRPATVRHLLTHTAGIREVLHPSGVVRPLFGETVKAGQPVPSLAEYYRPGLRIGAEPGTRFRYTDHGFATLGQLVEDVTGQPFDRYLREHVFAPLGMADTDLVRSDAARSRLATGYELRAGGARPYPDYEVVTAGGAAAYSTPRDIARYLAALLGGGANEHGSVLKPETLATMFAPHYQPDPRIPGLGLRSSAATPAAAPCSSTRAWYPHSPPRSSWPPTTASASWPSPTAHGTARSGCPWRWTGCSTTCLEPQTRRSASTCRTTPSSGPTSAAGTTCPAPSPTCVYEA